MTRYPADQIRHFLETVDRHLETPVRLVIVGGGAALLQHGAHSTTRDIDTFGSVTDGLETTVENGSTRARVPVAARG